MSDRGLCRWLIGTPVLMVVMLVFGLTFCLGLPMLVVAWAVGGTQGVRYKLCEFRDIWRDFKRAYGEIEWPL